MDEERARLRVWQRAIERELIFTFAEEIAARVKRPVEEIRRDGLCAQDFPHAGVRVHYEDRSHARFRHAFSVERGAISVVFTEHCGYFVVPREGVVVPEQETSE